MLRTCCSLPSPVALPFRGQTVLHCVTRPLLSLRLHSVPSSLNSSFGNFNYTHEQVTNRRNNAHLVQLVDAFRRHGHLSAHINPLLEGDIELHPLLHPSAYGFDEAAMQKSYDLRGILHMPSFVHPSPSNVPFTKIWEHLYRCYCGRAAFEYAHTDPQGDSSFVCTSAHSWA